MDNNVKDLIVLYDQCISKLKRQSGSQSHQWRHHVEQERAMHESRKLLAEFADITAHKALVDARISVLSKDYTPNDLIKTKVTPEESIIESLMESESFVSNLSDLDIHLKSSTVFDAEFQFLFQHYTSECRSILDGKDDVRKIQDTLDLIEKEIIKLEKHFDKTFDKNLNLSERLANVTEQILEFKGCEKCEELQNTMYRISSEHDEKMKLMQEHQEENLVELRGELENERASQAQLRERARKLERRLGTLDSEYSQQVESLRAAYNKTLSNAGLDRGLQGEENIRQRYQAEIEQLRVSNLNYATARNTKLITAIKKITSCRRSRRCRQKKNYIT